MSYIVGERTSMTLFPASLEDYVSKDDPVRAYDTFVDKLDLDELGIKIDESQVGAPQYDPKSMLKMLVYGYSYGIRSSRKLERAVYHNLSFIWLMGGLKPDHKTIAEFRRNNREVLRGVLRQSAKMCIKLGLIEGNTLFIDGSKFRANAGWGHTWDEKRCEKKLKDLDERIERIVKESEHIDEEESGKDSLVKMKKELQNKEALKSEIGKILEELKAEDKKSLNTTDRDCVKIQGRQGIHAGYNAQIVTDEKHGLIVNSDVVSQNNDYNLLSEQKKNAEEVLDKKCETVCADSGYSDVDELKKVIADDIRVVVPSKEQSAKEDKPFSKSKFKYDKEEDEYICPQGNRLRHTSYRSNIRQKEYRIKDANTCKKCTYYKECTNSKRGRKIRIKEENEKIKKFVEEEYLKKDSQEIYRLRQLKVELPYGHIKKNLETGQFLLRGLKGVRAEMSLLSTCFNMARMITLLGGTSGFIGKVLNI